MSRTTRFPGRMSVKEKEQLIGRRAEIAELERAITGAAEGRGGVVLLAGEAGVGKTRLAEHALARSGLHVLAGRAREDSTPPYGPIVSALRALLRRSSVPDLGPLASYLSMLLPELGPAPDNADPETLTEALIGALAAAGRRHATAILVDDLQWADNATLELLSRLAEHVAAEPLLVVATYRSDEIARGHPVRRLRAELRRARHLNEVTIGPLAHDATAHLLARVLDSRPARELTDLVFDKTQGIPLYVEELAGALIASGSIEEGDEGMTLIPGKDVPIPESIRDAVLLRMDTLSEHARNQLEIAAVTGVEFDLELVISLAGEEAGIQELLDSNFVFEAGPGSAGFRHALIRDAIRGEIAWSRRRSLNRRIAAYLDRGGSPPELVAEHWLAAGEHEPARRALLELADRSCRLNAYRDAAEAGHRALEIWPAGEEEEKRLDALQLLARCSQLSGEPADAVRALREAVMSPVILGDLGRRAELLRALATVHELKGAWENAINARTEAAEAFEAAGARGEAAREWLAVAGRQTATSALDHALDTVRRASRLAAGSGRRDLEVRARSFEGNLLAMQGNGEAGRRLAQEALSLALAANHTEAASEAYRRLASVLDYGSDFAASRDAYATAVDYCRTQGDDVNARVCLGCMSAIVYRTGEWKRALGISREVIEDPNSTLGSGSLARAIIGLIRANRGEARNAKKHLKDALALSRRGEAAVIEMLCRFGLALVAELENDAERAAELHQEVIEGWHKTQDRHDMVPVFLWQSTFFGRHGRERAAAERADALATMASGTGNPEAVAALAHALGEVSLAAGNASEAAEQFDHALTQTEKLEIPLELAITQWRYGTALSKSGDRDRAVRRLTSAYRIARNLGARLVAGFVGEELASLGERVEEGRHPEGAASRGGLTRRQVEIVRLIASGLTNKEIAAKLFLSTRTVDMHVSNTLDRLDCRSRTEAARKAADLGLLD